MEGIDGIFGRTELLVGSEAMERIKNARVIVFGTGGVGSWCVEALVRTGIGHITLVDFDRVCHSNVNRQLPATHSTIGQLKVEAIAARMRDINPDVDIEVRCEAYDARSADSFALREYDYVIDASDSLDCKALLIRRACEAGPHTRLFSSMGAALKIDPSRIAVAEFWKVKGDPLAAALRRRFKKSGEFPCRKFRCVYSDELVKNRLRQPEENLTVSLDGVASAPTKRVNGTLAHITAIFGMTLASLVIRDLIGQ